MAVFQRASTNPQDIIVRGIRNSSLINPEVTEVATVAFVNARLDTVGISVVHGTPTEVITERTQLGETSNTFTQIFSATSAEESLRISINIDSFDSDFTRADFAIRVINNQTGFVNGIHVVTLTDTSLSETFVLPIAGLDPTELNAHTLMISHNVADQINAWDLMVEIVDEPHINVDPLVVDYLNENYLNPNNIPDWVPGQTYPANSCVLVREGTPGVPLLSVRHVWAVPAFETGGAPKAPVTSAPGVGVDWFTADPILYAADDITIPSGTVIPGIASIIGTRQPDGTLSGGIAAVRNSSVENTATGIIYIYRSAGNNPAAPLEWIADRGAGVEPNDSGLTISADRELAVNHRQVLSVLWSRFRDFSEGDYVAVTQGNDRTEWRATGISSALNPTAPPVTTENFVPGNFYLPGEIVSLAVGTTGLRWVYIGVRNVAVNDAPSLVSDTDFWVRVGTLETAEIRWERIDDDVITQAEFDALREDVDRLAALETHTQDDNIVTVEYFEGTEFNFPTDEARIAAQIDSIGVNLAQEINEDPPLAGDRIINNALLVGLLDYVFLGTAFRARPGFSFPSGGFNQDDIVQATIEFQHIGTDTDNFTLGITIADDGTYRIENGALPPTFVYNTDIDLVDVTSWSVSIPHTQFTDDTFLRVRGTQGELNAVLATHFVDEGAGIFRSDEENLTIRYSDLINVTNEVLVGDVITATLDPTDIFGISLSFRSPLLNDGTQEFSQFLIAPGSFVSIFDANAGRGIAFLDIETTNEFRLVREGDAAGTAIDGNVLDIDESVTPIIEFLPGRGNDGLVRIQLIEEIDPNTFVRDEEISFDIDGHTGTYLIDQASDGIGTEGDVVYINHRRNLGPIQVAYRDAIADGRQLQMFRRTQQSDRTEDIISVSPGRGIEFFDTPTEVAGVTIAIRDDFFVPLSTDDSIDGEGTSATPFRAAPIANRMELLLGTSTPGTDGGPNSDQPYTLFSHGIYGDWYMFGTPFDFVEQRISAEWEYDDGSSANNGTFVVYNSTQGITGPTLEISGLDAVNSINSGVFDIVTGDVITFQTLGTGTEVAVLIATSDAVSIGIPAAPAVRLSVDTIPDFAGAGITPGIALNVRAVGVTPFGSSTGTFSSNINPFAPDAITFNLIG